LLTWHLPVNGHDRATFAEPAPNPGGASGNQSPQNWGFGGLIWRNIRLILDRIGIKKSPHPLPTENRSVSDLSFVSSLHPPPLSAFWFRDCFFVSST
jgi:hypothetical protein